MTGTARGERYSTRAVCTGIPAGRSDRATADPRSVPAASGFGRRRAVRLRTAVAAVAKTPIARPPGVPGGPVGPVVGVARSGARRSGARGADLVAFAELLERPGSREVPALSVVHARLTQDECIVAGLNALRHDRRTGTVCEVDQ